MDNYVVFDEEGYRVEYYNVARVYAFWLPNGQTFKIPAEFLEQTIEILEEANLHKNTR